MRNILPFIVRIAFITAFLMVLSASGATLTVTKTVDTADGACDADCSLREAIAAAAGDTIEFVSPLFNSSQVITLSNDIKFQQLLILKNLTEGLEDFNFTAMPNSNAEMLANPKEIRGEKL